MLHEVVALCMYQKYRSCRTATLPVLNTFFSGVSTYSKLVQKQCLDLLMHQEMQHENEMLRVEKKPSCRGRVRCFKWHSSTQKPPQHAHSADAPSASWQNPCGSGLPAAWQCVLTNTWERWVPLQVRKSCLCPGSFHCAPNRVIFPL